MIKRLLYVAACIAVLAGCEKDATNQPTYSEPEYTKLYRAGAATVVVSLSETNVLTSGSIKLMIDVRAPSELSTELPEINHLIEPFIIVHGYSEPTQTLPNGHLLQRRVWELAPGLPGTVAFQPIEIGAADQTIRIEPIPITVTSVLPSGIEGFEIRDISSPIILLPEQEKKRRTLYTVIGVLFIAVLIPILLRLTKRAAVEPVPAPHAVAIEALDRLPEDETERVHELSRIFRAYHEARFNIPMLGQTAVELSPVIENVEILQFLQRCDDVRFSNKVPAHFAAEAEQYVREHIDRTKEELECD